MIMSAHFIYMLKAYSLYQIKLTKPTRKSNETNKLYFFDMNREILKGAGQPDSDVK